MDSNNNNINIENLAELAKINFSPTELEKYKDQIKNFNLNYWEIDKNKISGIDDLRKDEVVESVHFEKKETFQNAPENENNYFKIRKILDR